MISKKSGDELRRYQERKRSASKNFNVCFIDCNKCWEDVEVEVKKVNWIYISVEGSKKKRGPGGGLHPSVQKGERTHGLCYVDILPVGNRKKEVVFE